MTGRLQVSPAICLRKAAVFGFILTLLGSFSFFRSLAVPGFRTLVIQHACLYPSPGKRPVPGSLNKDCVTLVCSCNLNPGLKSPVGSSLSSEVGFAALLVGGLFLYSCINEPHCSVSNGRL